MSFVALPPARRSVRIAAKSHSLSDSTSERVDIMLIIADYCKEKGLEYSDALLDEFDQWFATTKSWRWVPSVNTRAEWFCKYYSKSLFTQERMIKCHEAIYRYCAKRSIEYTPQIYVDFVKWHQNPANYALVNNVSEGHTWPVAPSMTVKRFFKATKQSITN